MSANLLRRANEVRVRRFTHGGHREAAISARTWLSTQAALANRLSDVRAESLARCAPLSAEDASAQSMPEASPAKWHLAHTSWFFETLVLNAGAAYRPFDADFGRLFNSYYQSLGRPYARQRRGLLTRPSLQTVLRYRQHVDEGLQALLRASRLPTTTLQAIELGLQHEQQHQELIYTDLKHLFWRNPLRPAYRKQQRSWTADAEAPLLRWLPGATGVADLGADPRHGFAFDNETPRHRVMLAPHALASRPTTNLEYRAFIEDGGYRRPEFWLADGWERVQRNRLRRPLYWSADLQSSFTLCGEQALSPQAPVCHLSYYEADAYARWSQARLPTEAEWEAMAGEPPTDPGTSTPLDASVAGADFYGQVWVWTSSAYQAYPGYRVPAGPLGEYNGKFMSGQFVLRGSSWATPIGHARRSYRNFFPPQARWQFSGVRLALDL